MEVARFHSNEKNRHCLIPPDAYWYLVEESISERLHSLGATKWKEVENMVDSIVNFRSPRLDSSYLREKDTIYLFEQLASYELLKESAALLELALWKAKIDERKCHNKSNTQKKRKIDEGVNWKAECRMNCCAEIVIHNVMSYLGPAYSNKGQYYAKITPDPVFEKGT